MHVDTTAPPSAPPTVKQFADWSRQVKHVAQQSKHAGQPIPPTDECFHFAYASINAFLDSLEHISMTPELRRDANIANTLKAFFANPQIHFPEDYVSRAKALFEHFEAIKWGATAGEEDDDAPLPSNGRILTPPHDHPIWGAEGIMRRLAYRKLPSGTLSIAFASPTANRPANVYGDNGIHVGQWYPRLLAAAADGAHGHSQAGIYYASSTTPAFSVVIAGGDYRDLDDDTFNTIFYSGTGSHKNTDPHKSAEADGTRALAASVASAHPVRVLRSFQTMSYAPACGYRYDGLYDVKCSVPKANKFGGRYTAFQLIRRPGQKSVGECLAIPDAQQRREYELIEKGYRFGGKVFCGGKWKE